MKSARDRLLDQLRPHIADERVMEAMEAVPREKFVPPQLVDDAWDNVPLPIGAGQTISQPLVVARMCELLELGGDERILDVGTGSGYHAALLAYLGAHVWSIERHAALSEQARAQPRRGGGGERDARRRRRRARAAGRGAVRRDQRRGRGGRGDPARARGAARAPAAGSSCRSRTAISGCSSSTARATGSSARASSACASSR